MALVASARIVVYLEKLASTLTESRTLELRLPSEGYDWCPNVDTTQRNLLIFICVLVLVTLVAVLLATFGPIRNNVTDSLAKYGQIAVLGEIIAIFVVVSKNVFSPTTGAYSLVISMDPQWLELDVDWDVNKCSLRFGDSELSVKPALSPLGPGWEIKLPSNEFKKVRDTDVGELFLTDSKGNRWEGSAFYFFQRQINVRTLESKAKIMLDYGVEDG